MVLKNIRKISQNQGKTFVGNLKKKVGLKVVLEANVLELHITFLTLRYPELAIATDTWKWRARLSSVLRKEHLQSRIATETFERAQGKNLQISDRLFK